MDGDFSIGVCLIAIPRLLKTMIADAAFKPSECTLAADYIGKLVSWPSFGKFFNESPHDTVFIDILYERLDFGKSTFRNWKSGKSNPSLNMLEQIAQNANITISELLWEGYIPGINKKEQTKNILSQCRRIDVHLKMIHTHLLMEFSQALTDIAAMENAYEQNGESFAQARVSPDI